MQPCFSPIWDTALAIVALSQAGLPADDPRLLRAGDWLLDREIRSPGDWQRRVPGTEPGGWAFEYQNEFYPDTDDTAEVLAALAAMRFPDPRTERRRETAVQRAIAWQLAMQNADGGWPAFDRDCDNEVLTFIPFADHNAMIDPSCDDITGRTLEALARLNVPASSRPVRRGVEFLKRAPGSRRHLVWPLGMQLHLRNVARPLRPRRRGRGSFRGAVPARGQLAAARPEQRRRVGRAAPLL